jgi:hypothetical protein
VSCQCCIIHSLTCIYKYNVLCFGWCLSWFACTYNSLVDVVFGRLPLPASSCFCLRKILSSHAIIYSYVFIIHMIFVTSAVYRRCSKRYNFVTCFVFLAFKCTALSELDYSHSVSCFVGCMFLCCVVCISHSFST